MGAGSARYGVAVLILVILWIAVYWWTPTPAPDPVISFGEGPHMPQTAVAQPQASPNPLRFDPPAEPRQTSTQAQDQSRPVDVPQAVSPPPAPAKQPPAQGAPAKPAQTAASNAGVIPPAFRDYTVRAGDTAQAISRRFFGTDAYWQQIMKANPRVDFMKLRAGRVIRIPVDPANIQGVVDKSAPSPAPAIEYRVKSGDTLSEIANEIYGRASLWTVIRDANRDQVGDDGSRLRPGMTLKIPPAPSGAGR